MQCKLQRVERRSRSAAKTLRKNPVSQPPKHQQPCAPRKRRARPKQRSPCLLSGIVQTIDPQKRRLLPEHLVLQTGELRPEQSLSCSAFAIARLRGDSIE